MLSSTNLTRSILEYFDPHHVAGRVKVVFTTSKWLVSNVKDKFVN